jgi:hypothetical protein
VKYAVDARGSSRRKERAEVVEPSLDD